MTGGRYKDDGRKRGRAGQVDRKRRLVLYPLCAHCEVEGIVRATTVIDHKIPLAFGGADTDENCQGLCDWHNAVKTALENASAGGGATHPDWLQKPQCPAVIICGPPCGGKSRCASEMITTDDVLVDLDAIAEAIDPQWKRTWSPELLNAALRRRNAILGALVHWKPANAGRLILVVSAPSPMERQWWSDKLGATIIVRDPGIVEATRRAIARDGRSDHVADWYKRRALPWSPKKAARKRLAVDEDGFPVQGADIGEDPTAAGPGASIGQAKNKSAPKRNIERK